MKKEQKIEDDISLKYEMQRQLEEKTQARIAEMTQNSQTKIVINALEAGYRLEDILPKLPKNIPVEVDLEKPESQKQIVKHYLQSTTSGSDEDIEKQIAALEAGELLGSMAKNYHAKYLEDRKVQETNLLKETKSTT